MKKILKISALLLGISMFWFAGASSIDRFEIEVSPTKVKVWESIDVTLKAVDKSWNIVKDYTGEVLIFSQTDKEAVFPWILEENTYTFKAADAWVVKFENAVKFTKNGIQDISVYDNANYDIFWYAEVEVSEWNVSATPSWEITITYPEEWTTLWSNKISVSGTTSKNHKVKIVLNGEKDVEWISNGEGIFKIDVTDIPSGENVFIAELLDADGKTIASSKEVFFKIEANAPQFKSITLDPSETEYTPNTSINVTVEATSGLTTLNLILNDMVTSLSEKTSGSYVGTIMAPSAKWEYKIDIVMKNELWNEAKESWVSIIQVKEVELLASTGEDSAPVEVNCDDFKKELEVKNITSIKLKSKSVISWDKVEKASSYNVYKKDRMGTGMTLIENVTQNQYEIIIQWDIVEYDEFAVKAVFKDDVCNVESSDYSGMTKVQTGPKEMLFIIIALSLGAGVFFFRRKNA